MEEVEQSMTTQPSVPQTPQADNPNARHLVPTGDLTIFEAAEFKEGLLKLFENEGLVSLDLGKVTRVDSAVIQLLWAARKRGRLFVSGVTQDLQAKLTQLGFSEPLSE